MASDKELDKAVSDVNEAFSEEDQPHSATAHSKATSASDSRQTSSPSSPTGSKGATAASSRRHTRSASDVTAEASAAARLAGAAGASPTSPAPSRDELRLQRFKKLLDTPNLDLEALRQLSWSGVPSSMRATVWGLLSGYLPANVDRRAATLARKREEYTALVAQYYGSRTDESNQAIYHQIHIDVLRTNPSLGVFQQPTVQEMLERILYIWAIRHPGSGYVQGINDLVIPFFAVNLSAQTGGPCESTEVAAVDAAVRDAVEADCYWGLTKLLDGIQDNYTFASPRIQKNIKSLRELVTRMDRPLNAHLEEHSVEYLQFSFRWMNCLLLRELPLPCVIRLWDTYHAEVDGFATFHLYTCAAFLLTFSKELRCCSDFQSIMIMLQNLPTSGWVDKDIDLVLAEAYRLKYMFHDAAHHLV